MDTIGILNNLGVAEKQEGKIIFNNTGIFFFAKNLHDIYYHTAVVCALYKGNEKVDVLDRRDFNEDIIGNIDGAMNFLKQYIPVRYEMTGEPRRREIPEIPYEALREAVINAVAHRDYFEKGSNIMVEMFDDRIEISNFGGLVKGLKPEDFGKKSVLRNPNIANLLHRMGYIEKMGTGIIKMKKLIEKAGLPPIQFEFGNFFTVTFKKAPSQKHDHLTSGGVSGGVNLGFNDRRERILLCLEKGGKKNINQLVVKLGIPKRTLERDMSKIKKEGYLNFVGPARSGGYVLSKEGKKLIKVTIDGISS